MTAIPHYQPLLELEPEAVRCPHPYFERLREESPVVWIEELSCYAVTRHADALEVLRNPELFSSRMPTGPKAMNETMAVLQELLMGSPEMQQVFTEGLALGVTSVLLNADPPMHDRQRNLVNRAFSPRRVQSMERGIREIADGLIDRFVDAGRCEFVHDFAVGLPLTVIAGALGVPDADLATFKRWSDDFVVAIGNHLLTKERLGEMLKSQVEFYEYFTKKIEERQAQPGDDLISDVVMARIDGTEPLSTQEMLGMFSQFLVAGNETTTKLLASAMLRLLEDPEMMARVRADRALIPGVVEEALRLEAPVQGLFRVATADTHVGGVAIPGGSSLWVLYASANRDACEFPEPDQLNPERPNSKAHLSFGQGVHYCLGASLARAEARVGFEAIFDRLDDIQLAPGCSLDYEPSYILRGLQQLPLRFSARR